MRLVVGGSGEIGLVGRDQGQAETVGEADQLRLDRALMVEPVALDLDIEARAESLGEAFEPAVGQVARSGSKRAVDRPGGAAAERDQAVASCKRSEGNMRFVAVGRIEPERGDEAHQIAIAGLALGQEHDRRARVVPLDPAQEGGRRVAEVDRRLRADDRLDAALGELLGEFERPEQVVGVGDRQSRHFVGLGELGQRLDGERALAQRIGAMHVQMHEADGFQYGRIQELRVHSRIVAGRTSSVDGRRGGGCG